MPAMELESESLRIILDHQEGTGVRRAGDGHQPGRRRVKHSEDLSRG